GDAGKLKAWPRMLWLAVMFVAAGVFGVSLVPGRKVEPMDVSSTNVIAAYIVCCGLALLILKFVNPVSLLRLFATDYLIGFLLIVGSLTMVAMGVGAGFSRRGGLKGRSSRDVARGPRPAKAGAYAGAAILAATFTIVVFGFVIGSHFLHISLTNGRWWRSPLIVIAGFPLFLSDELLIRRIQPRWKSESLAILTRVILLAFILTGVLTFNRASGFLVLIAPLIVVFWLALWFAAGLIHTHT